MLACVLLAFVAIAQAEEQEGITQIPIGDNSYYLAPNGTKINRVGTGPFFMIEELGAYTGREIYALQQRIEALEKAQKALLQRIEELEKKLEQSNK
jgi:hypothetical protein